MNKYQYKVQGVDYDVEIEEVEGNIAKVNVNGIRFDVEMKQPINPASTLKKVHVQAPKPVSRPSVAPAAPAPQAAPQPAPAGTGSPVKAPLPGTITEIKVNVGDTVKVGDVVLVLEAMKMQNNIESEYEGTVTSITTKQGETVMEGAVLMTIG
ncbi:MAG: biotin/lipoyl-binding protein [Prevotella sp.]|nr:biotin/lipoyl-binding protein [Prevotella sp.]